MDKNKVRDRMDIITIVLILFFLSVTIAETAS